MVSSAAGRRLGSGAVSLHRGAERGPGAVLAVMCGGLMLSMFNSTMVNVILPAISSGLGASATGLQWVSAIYTLCYAAALLPGGALAGRIGRRASFLLGVAVFTLGSIGCAAAPSLAVLLASRVVQACGGAILLPQTLSILVHEFTDATARARAIGMWAGMASLGLAAGPVIGGLIVTGASWRWSFLVSAILGMIVLVAGRRWVSAARHPRPARPGSIDIASALVSALTLAALAFGLIESENLGWGSAPVLAAFAVAACGAAGFLVLQHRLERAGRRPLMPLGIWRSRHLIAANLAGITYFFTDFAVLYFFSIDLQNQRGLSPLVTGAAFLPMTIAMAVLGVVAGSLVARFGAAVVLAAGLVIGAVGSVMLALLPADPAFLDIEWRLLVLGIGFGLMSSPMSNLAVSSVTAQLSSTASAIHNMFRQIGGTLGVAALGGVVGSASAGLGHAMLITTAVIIVTAALVWRLTSGPRARPRPS